MQLFSDAAGKPGNLLADLGTHSTNQFAVLSFFSTNTVMLRPDTTYWVAVGNMVTNQYFSAVFVFDPARFVFTAVPGAAMFFGSCGGSGSGSSPPQSWDGPGDVTMSCEVRGIPVPEPCPIINLTPDAANVIISCTNGLPFLGWQVLSSTNLNVPFAQWNLVATNTFGPDGSFTFTNAIPPDVSQQFYSIRIP